MYNVNVTIDIQAICIQITQQQIIIFLQQKFTNKFCKK